jgi:hypothetical protein
LLERSTEIDQGIEMTKPEFDYKLTQEDQKRIKCSVCSESATTGQHHGNAPFWYHCDKHAEMLRSTGRTY